MKLSGSVSVKIITDPDTGGTKTYGSRSGSGSGTNGLERVQKSYEQIAGQFNCLSKNIRFCANILRICIPCIELCFDSAKNKRVAFRRNEH